MHWNLNDFTILSEYFHLKKNYVLPLYQISTFLEWNLQLLFRCLFFFLFPHSKTWRCCEMGRLFGSLPAPLNSIYICRHHCQAALLLLEVEQNVKRASVRAMTLFRFNCEYWKQTRRKRSEPSANLKDQERSFCSGVYCMVLSMETSDADQSSLA